MYRRRLCHHIHLANWYGYRTRSISTDTASYIWCPPLTGYIIWLQSSWGQHGSHLGPTGTWWAPCWPHELCYLGSDCKIFAMNAKNSKVTVALFHGIITDQDVSMIFTITLLSENKSIYQTSKCSHSLFTLGCIVGIYVIWFLNVTTLCIVIPTMYRIFVIPYYCT